MNENVVNLSHMDTLMDDIDKMFCRILSQVKSREDAILVIDMLENNTVTCIEECHSFLPYGRIVSFKKAIKKAIKKERLK